MYGIVGYIGENQGCSCIAERSVQIEYRGYDSAGISVYHDVIRIHR